MAVRMPICNITVPLKKSDGLTNSSVLEILTIRAINRETPSVMSTLLTTSIALFFFSLDADVSASMTPIAESLDFFFIR